MTIIRLDYNQKDESITQKFTIRNPGDCTSHDAYGFLKGKPCVLVKMNKVKLNARKICFFK